MHKRSKNREPISCKLAIRYDMIPSKLTPEQVEPTRRLIAAAEHIVILTHTSPDGDAMGSSLSLFHYLRAIGKSDVTVIVPTAFPAFLRWMPAADRILIYESTAQVCDERIAAADLILCTDFNEPKRIGIVGERMVAASCPKILIDHHLHPSDFADVVMSFPESPSASELVYFLLSELGFRPLPLEVATCIYTGMMTDTGNFSYNSNHAEMYEIIAELVAAGVNKDAVYNSVFNNYSADRMRLMGYCLYQKMRIFPEHHLALIYLSRKELYRFNFQSGDAEGIVNLPLQIGDIHYSCFMREDKVAATEQHEANGAKSKIKISFRSQGDRPVNIFAHEVFNGGGHANAAGGEYYGPLAEAVEKFLHTYKTYIPSPSN